jgi:hypothetical protein
MTNTVFQTDIQINDKNHKLISIGFYYKNDSRLGFGSMLSSPDDKPLDISIHQESFKKQLGLIQKGIHPNFKTTQDWADGLLNQLPQFINKYNKECGFEDGLQPLKHRIVDFNNRVVEMLHTIIVDNIYVLTQLGTIKNDEFNGISYHYEKKLTDDELVSMLQKMGV